MNIPNGLQTILISLGGIFCLYLGYRVFNKGAEKQFKLFSDLKGWKFKLANTAPGLFFAMLGAIILCSPVIVEGISILQKQAFINTYASKLIVDELHKRNEIILANKLNDNNCVAADRTERSPAADKIASKKSNSTEKAVVTADVLLVRKKPGTYYRVISSLKKGDIVTIKDTRGSWFRVSTDEFQDGWIHGQYAMPLEDLRTSKQDKSSLLLSSNHSAPIRVQNGTAE